jgi:tripartite-type tricarboxylate transporter receptor subunit TctC
MRINRRSFGFTLAATPCALAAMGTAAVLGNSASAADKPLTILLTVPPGTSSDTLARLLGEQLHTKLGRPIIVESKSGAGGLVAIGYLRQLDADGSTVMMAPSSAVSLLPLFMTKPPFDADKDLMPVVEAAAAPMTITVNPSSGFKTLAQYLEGVRKDTTLGSIGIPSPVSMGALVVHQLAKRVNLPLQTVPYRGGSPLLTDLLGGQIPASASILPDYLEQHRAGKLKILVVASDKRSTLAPEIPTFGELGYPSFVAMTSFGLFARSGFPPALADQYAKIVTEALATPKVVEILHTMGLEPVGGTPSEFKRKVTADRAQWEPVVKETGIKMDS